MPLQPLEPGDPEQIGRYRVLQRLGRGGMAIVYLGNGDSGKVAIKLIRPELAVDDGFRKRFSREARYASRVRQAFIAPVLDVGSHDGRPFLVTAYIEGPTVGEHVDEDGPMPPFEVERLGFQVAQALVAIHAENLIHRDLKPSNVILGRTGPRVIDFGITRALDDSGGITSQGVRLGTPEYMAPEQFDENVEVTTAADVFAWGGLMVFASIGRPPFGRAANQNEVAVLAYRVANLPPRLHGLDQPLRELVQEAMDKDPSRRPTARDLMQRLGPGGPADHSTPAPTRPAATEPGPAMAPTAPVLHLPGPGPERTARLGALGGIQSPGVPADGPGAMQPPTRLLVRILIALGAAVIVWLALPAPVRLLLALVLGGTAVFAVAVVFAVRSVSYRPRWLLWLAGGAILFALFVGYSYNQLNNRYWVGFADDRVAVLKGAGPNGFMGVHNTSRIEQSATGRQQLPILLVGLLDEGVRISNWAEGRQLTRCLPQLFMPAVDTQVGVQDDSDLCREALFADPLLLPVPRHRTLDATEHPPAVAATNDRVLLAWTGSDGYIRVSSSPDGTTFDQPRTLAARSAHEPALATNGSGFFIAWQKSDGRIALASSADGDTFGDPVVLEQTSETAPALAYGDGRLLLAWVGDGRFLHIMPSADAASLRFQPDQEMVLTETSPVAPDLLFVDETWYLAWAGTDSRMNIQTYGSDLTLVDKDTFQQPSDPRTEFRPTIVRRDVWILGWTRPDGLVGLFLSKSGQPEFVNQLALNVSSSTGVNMTTFGEQVLLTWAGKDPQPVVHVMALP